MYRKTMRLRLVQLVQSHYTIRRKAIVTVLLNMRKHFDRWPKDLQALYIPYYFTQTTSANPLFRRGEAAGAAPLPHSALSGKCSTTEFKMERKLHYE